MPIKPNEEEKKVDFIERCMSDESTSKEYSEEGEREEYCTLQWAEANPTEEEDTKEDKEPELAIPTPEEDEKEKDYMKRCMGEDNEEEACQIAWDKAQDEGEEKDEKEDKEEKPAPESQDLFIFDMIGQGGVTAQSVVADLTKAGSNTPINLRVNSAGGDVFEGIAIYNALKKHNAPVSVEIEGLAASMASVIMLAGDTISASENSLIMIHNPSIGIQGESKDLTKKAELLDKIKTQMVSIYTSKSKLSDKDVIKMMDSESWLTAEEAKEKGFIDNVGGAINVAANTKLEVFNSAPTWVLDTLNNPNKGLMDDIVDMLTNLKNKITGFKKELPEGVNILDEDAIKGELVNLAETINTLSSVNDELVETLQVVATHEATIFNLNKELDSKEIELNKKNATPSKVMNGEDPVISLRGRDSETSGWDSAMKSLLK